MIYLHPSSISKSINPSTVGSGFYDDDFCRDDGDKNHYRQPQGSDMANGE